MVSGFSLCQYIVFSTRLYYYETYYNTETKKNTSRSCGPIGRLDELKKQFDDPIAHFTEIAEQKSEEKKASSTATVELSLYEKMDCSEDSVKNVGHVVLKHLYKELELEEFWKRRMCGRKVKYNIEKIFRLLVLSRAL